MNRDTCAVIASSSQTRWSALCASISQTGMPASSSARDDERRAPQCVADEVDDAIDPIVLRFLEVPLDSTRAAC